MLSTTSACCAVTLNQQQEQNIQYHKTQCTDKTRCANEPANNGKSTSKKCTVVENGRVVVKPVQTQLQQDS
ncbi:hypothetical protein [Scytonema sp. PCC 10023]|uniref:hypothetical protein n=1 Tax=Scytonema sp. PCC 10023 TaxID=1680591 RepID=UPI0039C73CFC